MKQCSSGEQESIASQLAVPVLICSLTTLIGVAAFIVLTQNSSNLNISPTQQGAHTSSFALLAFTGAIFVTLVLLISASLFVQQNNKRLTRRNNTLEECVAERTHALTEMNQSLTQTKNELHALLTSIPLAVIGTDEDGTIISANPQSFELLGYDADELLGMSVEMLIPERYREQHRLSREAMTNNKTKQLKPNRTLLVLSKAGEEIDVEIAVNAYDADGKWIAVTSLRDIRKQIHSEQTQRHMHMQLASASKMETIGHLAGGIAHDFNNILTSIKGFTELAIHTNNGNDKKMERYLSSIQKSSERASDLVRQMVTFSRGDSQTRRPIKPRPIIKEAVSMLRAAIPSSITINKNFADEDLTISLDPTHLRQMIMNLVINAKDAFDSKGVIDISMMCKQLEGECHSCHENFQGEYVVIEVSDNGCGINPEHLEHVFDPFFSTKEVGGGSGLGLSMVHGITHSNGGHITIDSTPNRGTSVKLLFPLSDTSNSTHSSPEKIMDKEEPLQHTGHILVVDDEQIITVFMKELLEEWGFQVTTFDDPREALKAFETEHHRFDIMITDQTMPYMLGTELVAACRKISPKKPIILFSGYNQDLDETNYRDFGVSVYLNKPINSDMLRRYLNDFLSPSSQQQQA